MPRARTKPNIHVQNPEKSPFAAGDLTWVPARRHGNSATVACQIAYIPWNRVPDFVAGCEQDKDAPALFIKTKTSKPSKVLKAPKATSHLGHTWYECQYGPEDHREDPDLSERSIKRGCICKFSVKRLYTECDVAEIAFYHMDHTNRNGVPVHGRQDPLSKDKPSQYAGKMSREMRQYLYSLFDKGLTSREVFEEYKMARQDRACSGEPANKDDFVKTKDVRNIGRRHKKDLAAAEAARAAKDSGGDDEAVVGADQKPLASVGAGPAEAPAQTGVGAQIIVERPGNEAQRCSDEHHEGTLSKSPLLDKKPGGVVEVPLQTAGVEQSTTKRRRDEEQEVIYKGEHGGTLAALPVPLPVSSLLEFSRMLLNKSPGLDAMKPETAELTPQGAVAGGYLIVTEGRREEEQQQSEDREELTMSRSPRSQKKQKQAVRRPRQ